MSELSELDIASWSAVAAEGSDDQVLEFVEQSKLSTIDHLERVAWRLADKQFFLRLMALLRKRGVFNYDLW